MGTPKGTIPHNAGKGLGWVDSRGYRVHSRTVNGKRQQVREHRAILETCLCRTLEPWEVVHHKDGDTLNNSPENLELLTVGEHTAQHHKGSRHSYDARRTMEAMASMREEIKRLRSSNTDMLDALREVLLLIEARPIVGGAVVDRVRAAIAKAKT